MKQHRLFLAITLFALLALACNAVAAPTPTPAPTSTPEATKTAVPTATLVPTLKPTSTPRPTATKVPPTPLPAAKGEAVSNGKIEVTVIDMYRHDKIVPGGTYYYWAKPGYIIIDLFVKVKNLQSGSASFSWDDVIISEGDTSTTRQVFAGGSKAVSSREKVAPLSFGYKEIMPGSMVTFDDTVYLQIIYIISKDVDYVLFRIADTPLIKVNK